MTDIGYDQACFAAATRQGLDPIGTILTLSGIPWELWQTGGFCMVIHVACDDPRFYLWLTADEGPEELVMIGKYDHGSEDSEPIGFGDSENPPEEDGYLYVPLNRLVDTINELRHR